MTIGDQEFYGYLQKSILDACKLKETNGKLAIRCLRNQVEELKKKLATQEQQLQKEKRETIATVRDFWRDNVLEGGSRGGGGGKMVKAALNKN